MRTHALRRTFVALLAASALTALVPATASASDPTECDNFTAGNSTFLAPGQRLAPGTRVVPTPLKPEFVMQEDGNLVIYAVGLPGRPDLALWSTGTYGNPGAYALMQEDGNFVVYKKDGGPDKGGALWNSGTYGDRTDTSVRAWFSDSGELWVTGRGTGNNRISWDSGTKKRHAKLCANPPSGQQPHWDQGGWAESASVWLVLQNDNNLVMYRKRDGKAIWSSGTWHTSAADNGRVYLEMLRSGDLIVRDYGPYFATRWRTGTAGNDDAYALLQDDGNLVVYKKDGGPGKGGALWNSGTYNKI
ncbi:hypothetical protein ACFWB2_10965 [Streptomyces virginiae]|uniref:hypothetical protein n=1 Tax=Streptomyces virginiae TaxID=1961 RepID=UPI0036969E98